MKQTCNESSSDGTMMMTLESGAEAGSPAAVHSTASVPAASGALDGDAGKGSAADAALEKKGPARSRRRYDAVATVRTYKDKETGKEKKVRQKIGTVFENPGGSLSLKLDVIPIGPGWSGFIGFYEPGERGEDD